MGSGADFQPHSAKTTTEESGGSFPVCFLPLFNHVVTKFCSASLVCLLFYSKPGPLVGDVLGIGCCFLQLFWFKSQCCMSVAASSKTRCQGEPWRRGGKDKRGDFTEGLVLQACWSCPPFSHHSFHCSYVQTVKTSAR